MHYRPVMRVYIKNITRVEGFINVLDQECDSKNLKNACNVYRKLNDSHRPLRHCLTALSGGHEMLPNRKAKPSFYSEGVSQTLACMV